MHVNNFKPNILQDKIAASNGRDLRNRNAQGLLTAKRYNTPPKNYPCSSERQNTRKQRSRT